MKTLLSLLFIHTAFALPLDNFNEQFNQELLSPRCDMYLQVDTPFTIYFRGGLNSENEINDTFIDNLKTFENIGRNKPTVNFSWPDSQKTALEGAQQIIDELELALKKTSNEKILLLGHSKGGAELFLAFLLKPELFASKRIDDIVLLQSSIQGTSEAQRLFDSEDQAKLIYKILFKLIPGADPKIFLGRGMLSITPENMKTLSDELITNWLTQDVDHKALLKKLLFIRTLQNDRNSWSKELKAKRPPDLFLGDGNVDFKNQRSEKLSEISELKFNLKLRELEIESDHLGLFISQPRSFHPSKFRVAFTRALLKHLGYVKNP